MYSLVKQIPLPKAPSMGFNNLSSLITEDKIITVCYSHRSWIIFLTIDQNGEVYSEEALDLHTDSSVTLEPLLIRIEDQTICAIAGLNALILAQKFDSWAIICKIQLAPETATTCVTHYNGKTAFGSSEGEILILKWKNEDRIHQQIQAHNSPLICIAANASYLVSSDEKGCISIKSSEEENLPALHQIKSQDLVLIMTTRQDCLYAASSNGKLFIYNMPKGEILSELRLHVRNPVALQISALGKLISAAEDCLLYVWNQSDTLDVLELDECLEIKEAPLVGVAWMHSQGHSFLVAPYDRPHLLLYTTKP